MKKALTVVLAVLFAATASFAAVDTVTKSMSQAGYPEELKAVSIMTAQIYPSLLPQLSNVLALEYGSLGTMSYLIVNTDLGTISLSSSPLFDFNMMDSVDPDQPDTKIGLGYAVGLDGMTVGGRLTYGAYSQSDENKLPTEIGYTADPDTYSSGYSNLSLNIGASIEGDMPLDIALKFTNANEFENNLDKDNTTGADDYKDTWSANITVSYTHLTLPTKRIV